MTPPPHTFAGNKAAGLTVKVHVQGLGGQADKAIHLIADAHYPPTPPYAQTVQSMVANFSHIQWM